MLKKFCLVAVCAALSACGESNSNSNDNAQYQVISSSSTFTLNNFAEIAKLLDTGEVQLFASNRQTYTDYIYDSNLNLTDKIEWDSDNQISQHTEITIVRDKNTTAISSHNMHFFNGNYFSVIETTEETLWNNAKKRNEVSTSNAIYYDHNGDETFNFISVRNYNYNGNNQLSSIYRTDEQNPQGYKESEYIYANQKGFSSLNIYTPDGEQLYRIQRNWDSYGRVQTEIANRLQQGPTVDLHFFIYNNDIDSVIHFSIPAEDYKLSQTTFPITVHLTQFTDVDKCSEYELEKMQSFQGIYSDCRIKPESPSTASLPTAAELGL
ncbi:hypothetical protein ACMZOO_06425 [Catenovulum sp. SX2]|uniref:hypothetical protein n=1 Tax=Catenovulum sp. SX2 TaxID=3398614 RepID=UPI003F87C5A0